MRRIPTYTIDRLLRDPLSCSDQPLAIITGIDVDPLNSLYEEAKKFFDSPDKRRVHSRSYFGYTTKPETRASCAKEIFELHDLWPEDQFDEEAFFWISDAFKEAFSRVFDQYSSIGKVWVSQNLLGLHYYPQSKSALYRIAPHTDGHYTLGFAPRGEPLESFVNGVWIGRELKQTEAVYIADGVSHRVMNFDDGPRLAITFAYPVEAF